MIIHDDDDDDDDDNAYKPIKLPDQCNIKTLNLITMIIQLDLYTRRIIIKSYW